jgi:NADH pyrophosphatase NudC (nudix superfamily)
MWLLVAVVLLIIAAAVVMIPFFRSSIPPVPDVEVDPKLLALYNRRDQLYQAIREAKFDLDTGKLSPEDYERQVAHLKRQAARVLKAIDQRQAALATADLDVEAERLVREARKARASLTPQPALAAAGAAAATTARYCPQCGTRVQPGDRFCPACGASLT